ncbi:C39 family peptidase [Clostridium bowmanii]|uniref:C39 family peptidase n=1 Tax=Clostridium bowmanii TaxID=132925 RepID=UPI001C0D5316|nr:C39 family peptidase [Clostridium bowmanii]MBU3192206.1 C39 family peptidase [Clostridium bowmanii]
MNKKLLLVVASIALTFSLTSNVFAGTTATGINEGFTKPGQEQIQRESKRAIDAEAYVKNKRDKLLTTMNSANGITPMAAGGSKINNVGTFRQSKSYTCGPTSARNLIQGYVTTNGGSVPSENTLATSLGTTSSGTGFDASPWETTLNTYANGNGWTLKWGTTNWNYDMSYRVISTIDAGTVKKGFDVIGNLNHGVTTTPINSVYKNGAAHYICIHGYNDSTKIYNIADSNSAAPVKYTTYYLNAANSTKARGIIW